MDMHDKDIVIDNTLESRKLLNGDTLQWLRAAFKQFKAFPFVWITLTLVYLCVYLILIQNNFLAFLGILITPVLNGGVFIAAATGDRGVTPRVEQLFSAFKTDAVKLMITGAVWGLISVIFQQFIYAIIFYGVTSESLTAEQLIAHLQSLPPTTGILILGLVWVYIFFSIAYNIIPGLIIFNRLTPTAAYRFAFSACLNNWQPIMLYMLLLIALGLGASLPLLLGWIVLLPIIMITNFYIWRELFTLPLPHTIVIDQHKADNS
jgi:uncharacterized membrane protein